MNRKSNNAPLVIITAIVTAIFTSFCVAAFLKGRFFQVPQGTHKAGLISALGVLLIVITISALSLAVMVFIKKSKTK